MKLNLSHKYTKVEEEDKIDVKLGKKIISLEIGNTVEREINHIEAEEIMIENTGQITEVEQEMNIDRKIGVTTIDKMTDMTVTGKNIGEKITEIILYKIMVENRDLTLEIKVEIILETITGIIQGKDLSKVEIEAEIGVEKDKHDHDLEHHWKIEIIGQDQNQDLDQIQG